MKQHVEQPLTYSQQHHMLDVPPDQLLFLPSLEALPVSPSNPVMRYGLATYLRLRLSPT
jgi:hypothetical protein